MEFYLPTSDEERDAIKEIRDWYFSDFLNLEAFYKAIYVWVAFCRSKNLTPTLDEFLEFTQKSGQRHVIDAMDQLQLSRDIDLIHTHWDEVAIPDYVMYSLTSQWAGMIESK